MKNKNFLFLLPLLTVIWLYACQKQEEQRTVINGHITEYGTNAPIGGARVYLWCYEGVILGGGSSTFLDSLVTDTDGAFHTDYLAKDICGGIYLSAFREGYFYRNDIDIHSGINDLEIVLDPEAWLNVVTVPDIGIEHLFIGGDFLGSAGYEVFASDGIQEKVFLNRGNRHKIIRWRPWGEVNETIQDTVYLPAHDSIIYTIYY